MYHFINLLISYALNTFQKLRNTELNNKRRMWYNASTVMIHQLFEYKFVAKVKIAHNR